MLKSLTAYLWLTMLLLSLFTAGWATSTSDPAPLPFHCGGGGPIPLDPDYCGCTWGRVYYRGQMLTAADVTLHFQEHSLIGVLGAKTEGIYQLTGKELGAIKGDMMTVTVAFAGQTAIRPFRAWPDNQKEQEVSLVLPEQGAWIPWLTGGYTRTLIVEGHTLWAGGPAGLISVDLTSGVSATHTLPWPTQAVVSVAPAPNGHAWAASLHHLAEFDGAAWQDRTVPFADTIRTILRHPITGALWAGGGDSAGALAVYDGQWHTITAVPKIATALTADAAGDVWVGTWEGGLYRHRNTAASLQTGWSQLQTNDGLASNRILALATYDDNLWIGTAPYRDSQADRGGISRYDLINNAWETYTITHGLPADALLPQLSGPVYALALEGDGVPWAGTARTVHQLAMPSYWITDTVTSQPIRAVATFSNTVIAARADGVLLRLDQGVTPGSPPTAQLTTTNVTLTTNDTLTLQGTGSDQDETTRAAADQILAWDWRSNLHGPLCTTAGHCTLPATELQLGVHTIQLRVQDDEGVWSAPATVQVTISDQRALFLPLLLR